MTKKDIYQKHDNASNKAYIDEAMLYACMTEWTDEELTRFALFLQQAGLTPYSAEYILEQFKTFER
jgi:hypothetical protein